MTVKGDDVCPRGTKFMAPMGKSILPIVAAAAAAAAAAALLPCYYFPWMSNSYDSSL
jgi:hypothetical protein